MEDVRTPQLGAVDARPMSPHLGIWRWHITMWGSILHRATGVILHLAAFVIAVWWAVALASGPGPYADFLAVAGSWFGRLVFFGLALSFFYHLANGVRHLVWDSGRGVEVRWANQSGAAVMIFAAAATAVVFALAWRFGGLQG